MIQTGGEFETRIFNIEYLVSFTLYQDDDEIEINCVTVDGEEVDYYNLPDLVMRAIVDAAWDCYYDGGSDVY